MTPAATPGGSQDPASVAGRQQQPMWQLCEALYPIARSLTGAGVRRSLELLAQAIATDHPAAPAVQRHAVASGSQVFDWTIPQEWAVDHARLIGPDGNTILDFEQNNLCLMGYSVPVQAELPLAELQAHLFSMPDRPDWTPYRTSYYAPNWGFCLPDRLRQQLPEGRYTVDIATRLFDGQLDWGEVLIPGETGQEILVSTHVCHPSLANDNLSGIAVAAGLIRSLAGRTNRLGLRFIFVPATIGAVAWLAANPSRLAAIRHTLVLSNLGDAGHFHYKASPDGDAPIDRVFEHIAVTEPGLARLEVMPFSPYGYDERQYNSPGIRLRAGSLMRTPFGQYPQYHTSADDLSFISPAALTESLTLCLHAIGALQADRSYRSLSPMGEPQLGKRGLYQPIGGDNERQQRQLAMLWMLNQADGRHSLLDVARRAGLSCQLLAEVAEALQAAALIEPID